MPSLKENARGAGILMHITSLPSKFGCGDFGPEAFRFADFLRGSGQKFWQILPLGHTDPGNGYSPYSATSGMAINTRLISPELLVKQGLLSRAALRKFSVKSSSIVDFERSTFCNRILLAKAFKKFQSGAFKGLNKQFLRFCEAEKDWLNDFAFYVVLKNQYENLPWYKWPDEHRTRMPASLRKVGVQHGDELSAQKWFQFIGHLQWSAIQRYCRARGIRIIGDIPIYVGHDSADAWSHPDLFSLTKTGELTAVAGVPPDYFNADGQLWGMPVFRWQVVEKQRYAWWVQRIKKNLELYDIIRLDHFRAFSAYWEVKAKQKTAKRGVWKQGPGIKFFDVLRKVLGGLPFIAEDLGDIDQKVVDLRNNLEVPGMKVLQFAFGDDRGASSYAPHNYGSANAVVYTGTHDNNTTVGWYRRDIGKIERERINNYIGRIVSARNIHHEFMRLAYSSISNLVIIPMQDVLGLDERSRMNLPASTKNNWRWRLLPGALTNDVRENLSNLVRIYNR